jgi:hypothetical protein
LLVLRDCIEIARLRRNLPEFCAPAAANTDSFGERRHIIAQRYDLRPFEHPKSTTRRGAVNMQQAPPLPEPRSRQLTRHSIRLTSSPSRPGCEVFAPLRRRGDRTRFSLKVRPWRDRRNQSQVTTKRGKSCAGCGLCRPAYVAIRPSVGDKRIAAAAQRKTHAPHSMH